MSESRTNACENHDAKYSVLGTDYSAPAQPVVATPASPSSSHPIRRLLETVGLLTMALLLFRAIGVEPYGVPTGSMAPALMGNHKIVTCPRCGYEVRVGHRDDLSREPHAECPNCGFDDLPLDRVPISRGDHLLVNKSVFTFRRPRRWEMVVFRCPAADGKAFVKRVVGLPGEFVQVHDGDIYIDGELARKDLADLRAVRIPVFDQNYLPAQGWECRWKAEPAGDWAKVAGKEIRLDARNSVNEWRWLVYQHWNLDDGKVRPVCDEYSYNGFETSRHPQPVHDFLLECDVEVKSGKGAIAIGVTDGHERLTAKVPTDPSKEQAELSTGWHSESGQATVLQDQQGVALTAECTHHVQVSFFDRRAILTIDGQVVLGPVDRPPAEDRPPVERPVRLGVRGAQAVIKNIRIFRDVHYTESGPHATQSPVHLGPDEYFVLGDNSPSSDDNRFWSGPDNRPLPVPAANLLGKPFLVHMPSRTTTWEGLGRKWEYQAIDWEQIRWLH
jgi:signal peptidase I